MWSRDWPKKEGWYWFTGNIYTPAGQIDGLWPVHVIQKHGGIIHSACGYILSPGMVDGRWTKAIIPELEDER